MAPPGVGGCAGGSPPLTPARPRRTIAGEGCSAKGAFLKLITMTLITLVGSVFIAAGCDSGDSGEPPSPTPDVQATQTSEANQQAAARATAEAEGIEATATAEAGTAAATATAEAEDVAATATAEASVGRVGSTFSSRQIAVTLHSYSPTYIDPNQFSVPEAGFHFETVEVTVENLGVSSWSYNGFDFEIADAEGFRYEQGVTTIEPKLSAGELRPGDKVRGFLAMEVMNGATGLRLLYIPLRDVVAEWALE